MSKQFNVISGSDTNLDAWVDGLNELTDTPEQNDLLPIVDVISGETKKIQVSNLVQAVDDSSFLRISSSQAWERVGLPSVGGGNTFNCAAASSSAFIVGSGNSNFRRSTDNGLTWSTIFAGATAAWNSLYFAIETNTFMLGTVGIFLSTDDGLTWQPKALPVGYPTSGIVRAVWYDNNRYVAGGGDITDGGAFVYSDDGNTWVLATFPAIMTVNSVTYGNGTWIGVGMGGQVVISGDGATWVLQVVGGASEFKSVAYGNGIFVAVTNAGQIYTSADGSAWALQSIFPVGETNHILFSGDNEFVVCGDNSAIRVSSQGTSWIKAEVLPATSNLTYTAFANETYVISSSAGDVVPEIFRSTAATLQEGELVVGTGQDAVTMKGANSELLLSARRTTDFNFAGLPQNTPVSIPLDAGTYDSEDVSIAAGDGLITFKKIGRYEVPIMFVYGRDLTTSQALLMCGLEYDGASVAADDVRLCAKQDADDTWNIDNVTIKIQTTSINQTIRMMLWTDSADEDTILLKAAFSNYQSVNTPSLVYQIWKVY